MISIRNITIKIREELIIININDNNDFEIIYNDIVKEINKEIFRKYIRNLYSIIDNWKDEYINSNIIDGDCWSLELNYSNNSKSEYTGRADFPYNFNEFNKINHDLIKEVFYDNY